MFLLQLRALSGSRYAKSGGCGGLGLREVLSHPLLPPRLVLSASSKLASWDVPPVCFHAFLCLAILC